MKIKLFALSAVATLLFACGGGSKPEDVAKAFHEAITTQDYAAASDLATEEGKKQVDAAKQMTESLGGAAGEKPAKPTVKEVKCDEPKEDKTTCTCTEEGGKATKYELQKVNDKWLVNYNKLGGMDPGAGAEEPVMEESTEEVTEDTTATEAAPVE